MILSYKDLLKMAFNSNNIQLFVIMDNGDTVRMSEEIKIMCQKRYPNSRKQFINLVGNNINIPFEVNDVVHENGVIYIPRWMHISFIGETVVSAYVIDPSTIKNITSIIIQPSNDELMNKFTKEQIVTLLSKLPILCKTISIPHERFGFEITGLLSDSDESIEYGNTMNKQFKLYIIENVYTFKKRINQQQTPKITTTPTESKEDLRGCPQQTPKIVTEPEQMEEEEELHLKPVEQVQPTIKHDNMFVKKQEPTIEHSLVKTSVYSHSRVIDGCIVYVK